MRRFDVECPVCGKLNRGLYLEDSAGWMECDLCTTVTKVRLGDDENIFPVLAIQKLRASSASPDREKEAV